MRLMNRALAADLGAVIGKKMAPLQWGVGVRGGAEVVSHGVQLAHDAILTALDGRPEVGMAGTETKDQQLAGVGVGARSGAEAVVPEIEKKWSRAWAAQAPATREEPERGMRRACCWKPRWGLRRGQGRWWRRAEAHREVEMEQQPEPEPGLGQSCPPGRAASCACRHLRMPSQRHSGKCMPEPEPVHVPEPVPAPVHVPVSEPEPVSGQPQRQTCPRPRCPQPPPPPPHASRPRPRPLSLARGDAASS